MIAHSSPYLDEREERFASKLLKQGILSTGRIVSEFEVLSSKVVGVRYSCAVNSGSAGLFLVLKKLPEIFPDLKRKNEVIIPSFTCFALSNAVLMCGFKPVFADISPETFSLDINDVRRKMTKKTLCVIFVHSFGICQNIDDLLYLGVPVLEDIAQAFGGVVDGKPVGSSGLASVSSFYATKVITTAGEGGAIFSNERKLIDEIKDFIDYDKKRYDKIRLRFNFKMTDIAAAVGIVQIRKLKEILSTRKKIAQIYFDELDELEKKNILRLPRRKNNIFFRFPVVLEKGKKEKLLNYLRSHGIGANELIFYPLHFDLGNNEKLPNTEMLYKNSVSIPIHPRISENNAYKIARRIFSFFRNS